ncbi:hypothetical protein P691DRAFT_440982 [Macrolepiota fuliginosa MF-IS2]|uniref:Uncharacterized protein n=1 Tax=Macrolepiota fuliginosa MF-IS2 TaxID=1400762 RepID=A0A9P5XHY3_9AGAR|nr:hypothetical protein P691DRAFT_440982 [Macrolepiota fuliginosa MF-IS2]
MYPALRSLTSTQKSTPIWGTVPPMRLVAFARGPRWSPSAADTHWHIPLSIQGWTYIHLFTPIRSLLYTAMKSASTALTNAHTHTMWFSRNATQNRVQPTPLLTTSRQTQFRKLFRHRFDRITSPYHQRVQQWLRSLKKGDEHYVYHRSRYPSLHLTNVCALCL